MKSKYRVTVVRIDIDVPFKDKEYQKIGTNEDGEDKYGYVYFDDVHDVEEKIYQQTVETLNVSEISGVVNGRK